VQFLDLGDDSRNRTLVDLFHRVDRSFASLTLRDGVLRLHRGDQRAIGELMITTGTTPGERECLGYASFCARLRQDEDFASWFEKLLTDIEILADRADPRTERLVDLQNRLMDLIDFLDPHAIRFPSRRRDRLFEQPPEPASAPVALAGRRVRRPGRSDS
jgi:Fe-S-cluster formation regulator IscX/YfhJ